MKNKYFFCFLFIVSSALSFSQKTYPTGMSFTYSGGNNMGTPIGNCDTNKDIDVTFKTMEGVMELRVTKVCNSWSFLQHWFGSAYSPKPVFKNRFLEMRIKSTAPHDALAIRFQVSSGMPGETNKSIPELKYSINKADQWETKFFKLAGNADTVFKEIDYDFPNGSYTIDYVLYGDAAVPSQPVMNPVQDQMTPDRDKHLWIDLGGIEIPGRTWDGLTIEAKSLSTGFFDSLYFTGYVQWSVLHYKISNTSALSSDSVFITLKDTLRGTSSIYKFLIATFPLSLAASNGDIKVFPTAVINNINIEFADVTTAQVQIADITGKIIYTGNILNKSLETLDLSGLAKGIYFVKISGKNLNITKKIVKI